MTRRPGLTLLTVLAALGAVVSGAAGQPYLPDETHTPLLYSNHAPRVLTWRGKITNCCDEEHGCWPPHDDSMCLVSEAPTTGKGSKP